MSGGWNTIESDAGVFTHLLEGLGAQGVQFEELVSLETETLQALSPVYGVIFLFKWVSSQSQGSEPVDGKFDRDASEHIFFAQQTIQNACGTQALLSVLLNLDSVNVGDGLQEFKDFTAALTPDLRGDCLSNSELIRETHNSFARASPFADETQRPATDDDDLYHFIAYTPINGVLYELDGLKPAPISHGPCTSAEFPEKVVPVLYSRIGRYPTSEIRFNLMAMIQDPRIRAREIGDTETLRLEAKKRRGWVMENSLRKHNFVGFIGELMKGVVQSKLQSGPEKYEQWVEEAQKQTKGRIKKEREKA